MREEYAEIVSGQGALQHKPQLYLTLCALRRTKGEVVAAWLICPRFPTHVRWGSGSMHRASRPILIALSLIGLLPVWPAPPSSVPSRASGSRAATIEPTLPLTIDLRAAPAAGLPGGRARVDLEVEVEAGPEISDLSIALVLPDDLRALEDSFPSDPAISLPAAGRRRFDAHLVAARPGLFPVQVEVAFRDGVGREYHTRQGLDLRIGPPAPGGRAHSGAWEAMAVPLQELGR